MAQALSLDLRRRVVEAIEGGMTRRQAALRFGVSPSSAIRWALLSGSSGDLRPQKQGGDRKSKRIEAHAGFILHEVVREPDVTLAELQCGLRISAASTSASARCGASSIAGGSRKKKTAHAAEQQRRD